MYAIRSYYAQWAGSCWYYLRYLDPKNDKAFASPEKADYWLPVDLYVGGAEHAVLHLLYSRFWHKVLYDLGLVKTKEPFQRLINQGMITSFAFQRKNKSLVPTRITSYNVCYTKLLRNRRRSPGSRRRG